MLGKNQNDRTTGRLKGNVQELCWKRYQTKKIGFFWTLFPYNFAWYIKCIFWCNHRPHRRHPRVFYPSTLLSWQKRIEIQWVPTMHTPVTLINGVAYCNYFHKQIQSNGGPIHLPHRYCLEPEGNGYRIIRSVAFSQPLIRHYTYKSIVPQRFSVSGVSSMSPTYN